MGFYLRGNCEQCAEYFPKRRRISKDGTAQGFYACMGKVSEGWFQEARSIGRGAETDFVDYCKDTQQRKGAEKEECRI